MDIPSILISFIALIFSLYTFWFLTFRKGNIQIEKPNCFMLYFGDDNKVIIQIPLVFRNTGATSKVISSLRLKPCFEEKPEYFEYIAQLDTINFRGSAQRDLPLPILVPGNNLSIKVIEFQRTKNKIDFQKITYTFILQGNGRKIDNWIDLGEIKIDFSVNDYEPHKNMLFAYRN